MVKQVLKAQAEESLILFEAIRVAGCQKEGIVNRYIARKQQEYKRFDERKEDIVNNLNDRFKKIEAQM